MEAHQFCRLAEWVAPDLVARFDRTQGLPWDAAFHAHTAASPDPLAGWDLRDVSPLLHDAVLRFELPGWWRVLEEPEFGHDLCRLILADFGPAPGEVRGLVQQWLRQRQLPAVALDSCPLQIAAVQRGQAGQMARALRELGASVWFEKG